MKINTNNISYEEKDWLVYEKNFVPYIYETSEHYKAYWEKHCKFLNLQEPPRYALVNANKMLSDSIRIILTNKFEALSQTAQIGEHYAQVALKKDSRLVCYGKKGKYSEIGAKTLQYELLLFFDWVLLKKQI